VGVGLGIRTYAGQRVDSLAAHLVLEEEFAAYVCNMTDRNLDGASPDPKGAQRSHEEGNAHFRAKHVQRAAELYTEALRLLDCTSAEGRTQGAVLFGNRAACLLRWVPLPTPKPRASSQPPPKHPAESKRT
jgi:hypothetical protein